MGGFSYDRDDYSSSSTSGWSSSGYSYASKKAMSADILDKSMYANKTIKSKTKHPIMVILDVTGSNTNTARIVYDKFPMFSGQIEQQGYLEEFDICLIAVGDLTCDKYPLQVGEFSVGLENDEWLKKIVLEGGGGIYGNESYEAAASYLLNFMEMPEDAEPIVFFIADEAPRDTFNEKDAKKAGMNWLSEMENQPIWKGLRTKMNDNVFLIQTQVEHSSHADCMTAEWQHYVNPDHILPLREEKGVIDLMLGVISMVFGKRDMESYKVDMLNKGQTKERISMVESSLEKLSTVLAVTDNKTDIAVSEPSKKTKEKAKRL